MLRNWIAALFILLVPAAAFADPLDSAITDDLHLILKSAGLSQHSIRFTHARSADRNTVTVQCDHPGRVELRVSASDAEWGATFYYGLQKLGFLFPHPRMARYPSLDRMRSVCGETFVWDPRLKYRGFHLHTQHPNEWVRGFLEGDRGIAEDTVRWLARNGQNLVNVVLLRSLDLHGMAENLRMPFALARSLGISTGIDVSFAMRQQKSYALADHGKIAAAIVELADAIPFDFVTIELGTTEFSAPGYEQTLGWIESADRAVARAGRQLFIKIHVSVNQTSPKYGNYNFLPQYASARVGVLPHTVMFYSLDDSSAPVYGRRDFADMKRFLFEQAPKRPAWYFPETSYWVGMDLDVPLLLTDYLVARSEDFDLLEENGIQGQLCFTSGQELGSWLLDWTVALLVNREYSGDPLIGLVLLGEDVSVWEKIIDFQSQFIKQAGLLPILSASTLLDEVPFVSHPVHERVLLRDLKDNPAELRNEISRLEQAESAKPPLNRVHNRELRLALQVTWDRISHALQIRKALAGRLGSSERVSHLAKAAEIRARALGLVQEIGKIANRYPEADLFGTGKNPTSYAFGYLWPTATLHFWEREEGMVRSDNYDPFYMNIYDPVSILF